MKFLLLLALFFCFHSLSSFAKETPELPKPIILAKKQWYQTLQDKIAGDPEWVQQKWQLEIAQKKELQSYLSWTPNLQIYGAQTATPEIKAFSQTQLGVSAQLNLFQFGKDYYLLKARQADVVTQKLILDDKYIQLENQYLLLVFKNILLRKKIEYFQEIESLKRKTLKVAEQRFDRGNLARQQVEKVAIDLNNFESQKINAEKDLLENELHLKKYDLQNLERNWPFTELKDHVFKKNSSVENNDFKKMQLRSEQASDLALSAKAQLWPSFDLTGKYYKYLDETQLPNQWELNLSVTWTLWDNYSQKLNYLDSYKSKAYAELQLAQSERVQSEQNQLYELQLERVQKKLKKSFSGLLKLNDLYQDTEKLFSQGRLTVNELFQDQQLLLETKINFESDIYDFHQSLLNYCAQRSLRVWDCLD